MRNSTILALLSAFNEKTIYRSRIMVCLSTWLFVIFVIFSLFDHKNSLRFYKYWWKVVWGTPFGIITEHYFNYEKSNSTFQLWSSIFYKFVIIWLGIGVTTYVSRYLWKNQDDVSYAGRTNLGMSNRFTINIIFVFFSVLLFLLGIHKLVIAPQILTSRTRSVLRFVLYTFF